MGRGHLCRLAICLALALVAHALPPNPAIQALTEIATPHVTAERAAAEKAEAERAAAERAAEKAAAEKAQPASLTIPRTPWYLNTPATVATPTTTQPTAPAMTESRTEIKRPVDPPESASWESADPEGCDARADAGECIASSTNSAAKSALMRKECQAACWKSWKDHAAEREAANKEKAVAEKAAAEQAVAEKATAEKTVAEKAAAEKAVAEKAVAEKAAREKAAVTFQKAVAEKAATATAGMAAAVEAEFQKALAEKAAAEKAAAKEAAYQKAAAVRKEAAEQAALARKAEAERAAAARKAEAEQAAAARKTALEKADAEMNAAAQKEYAERAAAEKAAFEIGIAQRAALTEFLVPADEPPNCAHRALQGECALECLSQWCARTQCKVTCERSDVATRVAAQNAAAQQAYEENAAAEKATLAAILAPEPADCPQWAAAGECEANPDFMLTECHMACELAIEAEKAAAKEAAAEEAASEAEAAAEEEAAAAEAAAAKAYAEAEAAAEKEAAEKAAAENEAAEKAAAEKAAAEKAAAEKAAAEKAAAEKEAKEKAAKEKAAAKEEAAKEAAEEAAAEKAGSSFAQVLVIISDHESGATEFGHALNTHPCVFDLGEPFSYTSMVWSTTEHVTGCNMSSFADAIFDSGTGTLRRRSNPVLNQKILALSSSKKPGMRPTNLTGDASSLYLGLKYDFADYFVRVRDLVCEGVPKDVCPPSNCTITLNFFPQFVNANTAGQLVKERPPTKCMLARNEATMVAWEDALRSIAKNPKVAMMSLLRNEADRQFASFRQYSPAGTEFDCSLPRPPTSFATVSNSYTDGQLAIESCWAGASAADKCLSDALRPVGLRIEPMGGAGTKIVLASSGLSPTSPTCPCDGDGPILTNPGDDELIVTNKTELARSATVLRQSDQKRLVRAAARDVSAMTCRCEDDEPSHTQPEFAWNSTDLHNHPASGQAANLRMPRSASCSEPNTIFKRLANGELDQRAADDGATSTRMPPVAAAPVAAAPVAAAPVAAAPVAAAPANDALVERAVNEPHQPNRDQQLQPPTAAAIDTKAAKKAEKEAAEAAKKAEKEAAEAKKKADKEAAEVAPAPVAPSPVAPAPVAAAPVDAAPVTAAPVAAAPVAEQRAPVTAPDASAPVAAPPAKRAQTREQEQQRTRLASKAAAAVKAAKAWQVVAEKAAVEAKAAAEAQAAKAKAATEKAAAAKKDAAEKLAAVQVTEKAAAEKAVVENGNTEFEEPTWRSTADFHITASIPEAGPPW
eukprot:jgi/Chrpa1/11681/Chrysochromulina_OHIO_Genome00022101-RA